MIRKYCIALALLLCWGRNVLAHEADAKHTDAEQAAIYARIPPEFSFSVGTYSTARTGASRAGEYDLLEDSPTLSGEARIYSFPHRLHLDLDGKNRKDYFGEIGYGYRNLLLLRGYNRTLFHNLDNIELIDLDSTVSPPAVTRNDVGVNYGVKTAMNDLYLKFRAPRFPLHLYLAGQSFNKEGKVQQRFLSGSAWFNDRERTSRSRQIDWRTRQYTVGINSHLGYLEADLSHGEKRFDAGGDNVLYDAYNRAGFATTLRNADTYPHNRVAEITGSSNTLKVHTTYTGRLVASATLTTKEKKNDFSGAKADYLFGSGNITWMPINKLTVFLKYRRIHRDLDNPGSITVSGRNGNLYQDLTVRRSISAVTDTYSGGIRYRPVADITLRTGYTFEHIDRKDAEPWGIVDKTRKKTLTVSGESRLQKNLRFKAKYTHRETANPAYNTDPAHADEGAFSITWIPRTGIHTLLHYTLLREARNNLLFFDDDGNPIDGTDDRKTQRDRVLGSVSFLLSEKLTLTTSYAWFRNRTTQDIVYTLSTTPFPDRIDPGVPYKDSAHSYTLNLSYAPRKKVRLNTDITRTTTRQDFAPGSPALREPVSIASFSKQRIRETRFHLGGEMELRRGLRLGLDFEYTDFNDTQDNPHDELEDGIIRILQLNVTKKW